MKRGAPEHPKTLALARALGLERWGAVGIIESLCHFASHYAVAGDVGRFDDFSIAEAIGWKGDPTVLVGALNRTGWLDRCACHRLRVHDWPDHADQTVKRVLTNRSQHFAACYDDPSSVLASSYDETSQPLPLSVAVSRYPVRPLATGGDDEPPPTAASAEEAREKAIGVLGPPAKSTGRAPAKSRLSWLTPFGDSWRERWGEESEPPWGELGTALKRPYAELDHHDLEARWKRFLVAAERPEWARPARFVQGLGHWAREAISEVRPSLDDVSVVLRPKEG